MDAPAPGDGELRLSGPRVVIPESKDVIVAWSEKIRYGIKKNGYHGGVNPQEMVTPIAVLSPSENFPEGWVEVPVDVPSWWEEPAAVAAELVVAPSRTKPAKHRQTKLLFEDVEEGKQATGSGSVAIPETRWIRDLFQSPIFEQQKKLAGRSVPSDESSAMSCPPSSSAAGK